MIIKIDIKHNHAVIKYFKSYFAVTISVNNVFKKKGFLIYHHFPPPAYSPMYCQLNNRSGYPRAIPDYSLGEIDVHVTRVVMVFYYVCSVQMYAFIYQCTHVLYSLSIKTYDKHWKQLFMSAITSVHLLTCYFWGQDGLFELTMFKSVKTNCKQRDVFLYYVTYSQTENA